MENGKSHWQVFWAQVSWQLIRWYSGADDVPEWWRSDYTHQVELYLVSTVYAGERVKEHG